MEAKDTIKICIHGRVRTKGCSVSCHLAQAEITWDEAFKAGYGEAVKKLRGQEVLKIATEALAGQKQAGIRLVVEWIEENDFYGGDDPCSMMVEQDKWQAQKKIWLK